MIEALDHLPDAVMAGILGWDRLPDAIKAEIEAMFKASQ
jgi:hypothetical protein